jgi:hypothetical protein
MAKFRGLIYVKQGRVGTRSEGPDYYLQTARAEYLLQLNKRDLWKCDYELEFYCRRIVIVTGDLIEGRMIRASQIGDTDETLIGTPEQASDRIEPDVADDS